jgi:soluble lytic murein transglycosylase
MLTRSTRSRSFLGSFFLAPVFLAPVAFCLLLSAWLPAYGASDEAADFAQQRDLYLQARDALTAGSTAEYERLRDQLRDYPLLPYLEYEELFPRLPTLAADKASHALVDQFLERYPDTWLASKLERSWVDALVLTERWGDLLRYHNPANSSTETTCLAISAAINAGDTRAFDQVAPLWNVASSQPNVCDPVFQAWLDAGQLTPELAWDRFSKTLRAREHSLARYISRQMPAAEQALAELYLQVDADPTLLAQPDQFSPQHPQMREIVLHGLRQLSLSDAPSALQLWQLHAPRQSFDASDGESIQRQIAQRLMMQGHISDAEALLARAPDLSSETLISWLLRDALKQQNWPRVETWLAWLPEDVRQTERWQYWRARALAAKGDPEALAEVLQIYRALAQTRSFYGFLAADLLSINYELVDRPVPVTDIDMLALYGVNGVMRARELYLVGDELNARGEWELATSLMNEQQIIASGKLADSWGWHRNGIQAMIRAGNRDDLQLRFPLAYREQVSSAATQHEISPLLLFSIARQESAFMHDARSPAGALGLMQLMPATAQQTASRAGMRITNQDLFTPEINIGLGTRYLSQLLGEFNGNRVLAVAAYNAGPNRVRQWLRNAEGPLPLDIWIETIPFAETRGYVQNVLAYTVIYGYRLGEGVRMLTPMEAGSQEAGCCYSR